MTLMPTRTAELHCFQCHLCESLSLPVCFFCSSLPEFILCLVAEMTDMEVQEYFDNFFEEVFIELEDRV